MMKKHTTGFKMLPYFCVFTLIGIFMGLINYFCLFTLQTIVQ